MRGARTLPVVSAGRAAGRPAGCVCATRVRWKVVAGRPAPRPWLPAPVRPFPVWRRGRSLRGDAKTADCRRQACRRAGLRFVPCRPRQACARTTGNGRMSSLNRYGIENARSFGYSPRAPESVACRRRVPPCIFGDSDTVPLNTANDPYRSRQPIDCVPVRSRVQAHVARARHRDRVSGSPDTARTAPGLSARRLHADPRWGCTRRPNRACRRLRDAHSIRPLTRCLRALVDVVARRRTTVSGQARAASSPISVPGHPGAKYP